MTQTTVTPTEPGTIMSVDELRVVMSDSIRGLKTGETTSSSANAMSNAVGKILTSLKLEVEYLNLSGRKVDVAMWNRDA